MHMDLKYLVPMSTVTKGGQLFVVLNLKAVDSKSTDLLHKSPGQLTHKVLTCSYS